jgi:hypothetical protein
MSGNDPHVTVNSHGSDGQVNEAASALNCWPENLLRGYANGIAEPVPLGQFTPPEDRPPLA